jgi:hypothetical protein
MAAHIAQPTRSRRFIKVYLSVWALLAAGALAYLAILAFPPQGAGLAQASLDPAKSATSIETDVHAMQGSISEIRKDVSQLQETVGERIVNEKVVETRLSALEDRVSSIDGHPAPSATPATADPDKTSLNAGEPPFKPVYPVDKPADTPADKAAEQPAAAPVAAAPAAPIETGSIAKVDIVFGAPVVRRASAPELAVQLASGPSLKGLRQSWGHLARQHGDALADLKPRVARGKGGSYRLIAGPVATEADAARICNELGAAPKTCFATPYAGTPL